jgi:HAMP domain-containing protein
MQLKRLHAGFLGTRVGRKTLLHFLAAALLPVLVSSVLGIWYVRQTLIAEAAERVDRTAESATLILLRQMTSMAKDVRESPVANLARQPAAMFRDDELEHVQNGGAVLRITEPPANNGAKPGGEYVMRLLRRAPDGSAYGRIVTHQEIWAPLNELIDGDRTDLCVFTVHTWRRLHCSDSVSEAKAEQLRRIAMASDGSGSTAPDGDATNDTERKANTTVRELLGAHRDLYLRYERASPEWRLVTSENRALALAPAKAVTTSLCLLFALAMVSAFAFAHHQIRRSTEPLEALRDATKRVGSGDLDTPVSITSRDEYGELGIAFNGMTSTLSRQLTLLRVMDEVDQATLRHREIHAIAETG